MERSAQTVRPVWGLQYMLSRLAEKHPFLPRLTPDGVFGEKTLEAVMLFQRELLRARHRGGGPKDLGRDQPGLEPAGAGAGRPQGFAGLSRGGAPGGPGPGAGVHGPASADVPAAVLLSGWGVPRPAPTGGTGTASEQNVRWLQERAGLPVTGVMDQATWDALARLYELFVVKDLEQLEQKYSGGWG